MCNIHFYRDRVARNSLILIWAPWLFSGYEVRFSSKSQSSSTTAFAFQIIATSFLPFFLPFLSSTQHLLSYTLSLRRPWFDSGSVHVGFMVEKVAMGQVFLLVLRNSLVAIIHPCSVLIFHSSIIEAT